MHGIYTKTALRSARGAVNKVMKIVTKWMEKSGDKQYTAVLWQKNGFLAGSENFAAIHIFGSDGRGTQIGAALDALRRGEAAQAA